MKRLLPFFLMVLAHASYAQKPTFTANDTVIPYNGTFAYGTNPGYYGSYNTGNPNDKLLADLIDRAGLHSLRPKLYEGFTTQWGINVRLNEFKYYTETKGMHDIALFIMNGISEASWSTETVTCSGASKRSQLFKNMYLPIWDASDANKTPINENNYYANFVYKLIQTYGNHIKFVEVWNEPDFTNSGLGDKGKGEAGNWYDSNPNPCDLPNLYASVPQYVRMLRITYEVVKALKPSLYVTTGGIGYASFLDATLRVTDNPDAGKVTADYPLKGGAYFDVLSYHSYPQYNLGVWNNSKNAFDYFRHSDYAVQKVWDLKGRLNSVLTKYGYDGKTFPNKEWIITECNIPRKLFAGTGWIGSDVAQRNFVVKTFVLAQKNDIKQLYTYTLGDTKTEAEAVAGGQGMDLMGMYYNLNTATPATAKLTPAGIATKSLTSLIYGYSYDAVKTAALKLPATADGAAFTKNNQTYYVLWAKTTADLSETASTLYSFPGLLSAGATVYAWDYFSTGVGLPTVATSITLTGSPIVLKAEFLSSVTGLEEEDSKSFVRLFPNPAKDQLTVEKINIGGSLSMDVLDVSGRVVYTANFQNQIQQTLDVSNLSEGLYHLKFTSGQQTWVEKLVIE